MSTIPTIEPGVRIGHVHLKVADLERAIRHDKVLDLYSATKP